MNMNKAFKHLTHQSRVLSITGDQNSGKTFWAMVIAYYHLLNGGYVISNIPIGQFDADGNPHEATLPRYFTITTFAEAFQLLADIWIENPKARFLVLLDELPLVAGPQAWNQPLPILLSNAITITRKLRCSFIILAVRSDLLLRRLRDQEGLVHVRFQKEPYMIREHAQDALDQGHTIQQIVLCHWPSEGIYYETIIVKPCKQLAIPLEMAKQTGAVFFDSGGISDMSIGTLHGKPFSFDAMIKAIQGPSWDIPRKLYDYFHPALVPEVNPDSLDDPTKNPIVPPKLSVEPKGGVSSKKGVQAEVDRMLIEGQRAKDIADALGCSSRFVYERKRTLRAEGKIA